QLDGVAAADLMLRGISADAWDQPCVANLGGDLHQIAFELLDFHARDFEPRHLLGVIHRERKVAMARFLQHERRRNSLAKLASAADLDVAELRMLERMPRHE